MKPRTYNYCGNVRCNDLKPIERKFFRFIIRQLDYNNINMYNACTIKTMRELCNQFSDKYNVSYKQLMYYLDKWTICGFYNWGVAMDLGWFENLDKLFYEPCNGRMEQYSKAIPQRVRSKIYKYIKVE